MTRTMNADVPRATSEAVARTKAQTVPFAPPFRSKPAVKEPITFTFTVPYEHCAALRSAIDEISNEVGGRLEGPHAYDTEQALTHAACALGALRAEVFRKVPAGSKHYA